MRRLLLLLAISSSFSLAVQPVAAQDDTTGTTTETAAETAPDTGAQATTEPVATPEATEDVSATTTAAVTDLPDEERSFHQELKQRFIEGGVVWMTPVLICLILGLAIVVERVIYLNLASTNTDKLLLRVEDALNNGGVEAAKEVTRNTRGPVASIFYQGLSRSDEGTDIVEKTVISYGGVQMGLLERGLTWISLFIALAPMLGFLGTVVGMIEAFDNIAAAGDVSPSLVAGGIKVALLTTVFGLIVAIILQIFYNYLVSKIDGIVNDMENASISLIDLLVRKNQNRV